MTDRDNEGYDALLWWVQGSRYTTEPIVSDCLLLLLERGADIHTRKNDERSALLVSVQLGCPYVSEILLHHGANPNDVIEDGSGRTALMEACRQAEVDTVKLLLDQGADPLARDREGRTAADYADKVQDTNKRTDLTALLGSDNALPRYVMK
jgi:ankyrin repeat protein